MSPRSVDQRQASSAGPWPVKDSILERAGKSDRLKADRFDWAASLMVLSHKGTNFPASWSREEKKPPGTGAWENPISDKQIIK